MSDKNMIMKIVDAHLCYVPVPHFGEPKVHIRLILKRLALECAVTVEAGLLPVLLDVVDVPVGEGDVATLQWVVDCPVMVERDDAGRETALVSVYDESERLPLGWLSRAM